MACFSDNWSWWWAITRNVDPHTLLANLKTKNPRPRAICHKWRGSLSPWWFGWIVTFIMGSSQADRLREKLKIEIDWVKSTSTCTCPIEWIAIDAKQRQEILNQWFIFKNLLKAAHYGDLVQKYGPSALYWLLLYENQHGEVLLERILRREYYGSKSDWQIHPSDTIRHAAIDAQTGMPDKEWDAELQRGNWEFSR